MSSRKIVILDTNIIVQNFWLDNSAFLILLENINMAADELVIPEIVFDESMSQYEKKFNEQLEKIKGPIDKIEKQLDIELNIHEKLDFNKKFGEYRDYLEDMISGNSINKLEYPEVPHSLIARKYMRREKPFKNNGEGYCDALIWENLVGLLQSAGCESVTLITNNPKDFSDGDDGTLHPELFKELEKRDINPNRVKIYTSLMKFNNENIMPKLKLSESLKNQINKNSFDDFNFGDWLEDELFHLIEPKAAAVALLDLKTNDCDIHLSEIYDITNIVAEDVRFIKENIRYVELTAQVNVTVAICANWQQYYNVEEIRQIFKDNDEYPTPYACASSHGCLNVRVALMVEGEAIQEAEIELISINSVREQ